LSKSASSKPAIKPFAEGAASVELGGFTIENGTASIAMYGQTDLTRDQAGLDKARALLAFLQEVVQVLEGDPALPAAIEPPKPAGTVKNPFS